MIRLADGPPAGRGCRGPPPEAIELENLGKQIGLFGTSSACSLILILTLMVSKPGQF